MAQNKYADPHTSEAPPEGSSSRQDDASLFDTEKHEQPAILSDSDLSDDSSSEHTQRPRFSLSRSASGRSISRTVSEVRDGIPNQRDLELGEDAQDKEQAADDSDPNLVQWDGPEDPQNPKYWQVKRKWAAVVCGMHPLP